MRFALQRKTHFFSPARSVRLQHSKCFRRLFETWVRKPSKKNGNQGKKFFCKIKFKLRIDRAEKRTEGRDEKTQEDYRTSAVYFCRCPVLLLRSFISALFLSLFSALSNGKNTQQLSGSLLAFSHLCVVSVLLSALSIISCAGNHSHWIVNPRSSPYLPW